MLKNINRFGQKFSKLTKTISDLNALEQLTHGNTKPAIRKIKNKINCLNVYKPLY